MCRDVVTLQALDREHLWYATANREDGAHLDVVARDCVIEIGSVHF